MWKAARDIVSSIFFEDEIELYREDLVENAIGEELPTLVLVGKYPCNIQNNATTKRESVSGGSMPQTIRVSLPKETPLDKAKTYVLVITKARLTSTQEQWKVTSWTEAQISTVITAEREVAI